MTSHPWGRQTARTALTCLLLLLAGTQTFAAPIIELGRDAGLPSQQMHAATQGADGRLYFAGPSGLTVYDGQRATVLGTAAGLSTHGLRSVATRADGLLAVGGDAGADLQQPDGRFVSVAPGNWRWGFVEDILALPDGRLFFAASRGLLRWHPEEAVAEVGASLVEGRLVNTLAMAGGTVWAAGPDVGLIRGDGDSWQRPDKDDWRAVGAINVLAGTAHGTVIVAGERGLVEVGRQGEVVSRYLDASGRSQVTALAVDGDNIWAGMGNRLVRLRRADNEFRISDVLRENTLVNDLYVDAIGSVWVATDNRSMLRIGALHDLVWSPPAPCDAAVMAVDERADGSLLVAGDLCSWRVDPQERPEPLPALDNIKTWDLHDHDGVTWAATDNGLLRLGGTDSATRYGAENETLNAPGRVLATVDDMLWIGTVRGLVRMSAGAEFEPVPVAAGDDPGYVYTIVPRPGGEAWVGTIGEGLWRWNGRRLARADIEGLPATGNAYAVAFSDDGRMAVSLDDTLYLVEQGRARALPAAGDDQVAAWSLRFDADRLWAGTSSGLRLLDPASGELMQHFSRGIGLADQEFTTSRSLLLRDDEIVAATAGGLTYLQPDAITERVSPPQVALAGVVWRNAQRSGEDRVRAGNWSADVHFYAPWFYDESSLTFRYRLAGFSEDWVNAGSTPAASYTALPAGRYTLYAQAYAPVTGWGPEARLWTIGVQPPLWQHPLALLVYTLLPLLLVWAGSQWRTQVLRSQTRKLERAVDERTAELARANVELHRLAGQKDRMVAVVAHDLRSPFAVIDMYSSILQSPAGKNTPSLEQTAEVMQRAASQGMNVIDSMLNLQAIESGRLTIMPQPTEIVSLLEAEAADTAKVLRDKREIELAFESSVDEREIECDGPRITQVVNNLVNNAAKYSANGSRIDLRIETTEDGVRVIVKDRGTGIEAEDLDKVFKPYKRSKTAPVEKQVGLGIGLTICRLLVEQHGGEIGIDSTAGEGTTVWFTLPAICKPPPDGGSMITF